MSNQSDTPETDAEHARFPMGGFTLDFARRMERERDEARRQLSEVTDERDKLKAMLTKEQGVVTISKNGYVQELERERDEARADAIRWQSIAEETLSQ